jgi:hypothetical protein
LAELLTLWPIITDSLDMLADLKAEYVRLRGRYEALGEPTTGRDLETLVELAIDLREIEKQIRDVENLLGVGT